MIDPWVRFSLAPAVRPGRPVDLPELTLGLIGGLFVLCYFGGAVRQARRRT